MNVLIQMRIQEINVRIFSRKGEKVAKQKKIKLIPIRLPSIPRGKIHSSPKGARGYTREKNRRIERENRNAD